MTFREAPRAARHFSMIRGFHLADFLTLSNAACGMIALFQVVVYGETRDRSHLLTACALIPLALTLDVLDGWIARRTKKHSALGRELDSLADVISFGVAPAVIAYGAGLRGLWDAVILIYFVACGVSRLARFNITADQLSGEGGKVRYFGSSGVVTMITLISPEPSADLRSCGRRGWRRRVGPDLTRQLRPWWYPRVGGACRGGRRDDSDHGLVFLCDRLRVGAPGNPDRG